MFLNSPEYIEPLLLDFENTIVYRKIENNEIKAGKITNEEHKKMAPSQTKRSMTSFYLWIVFCVLIAIAIFFLYSKNRDKMTVQNLISMIVIFGVFAIVILLFVLKSWSKTIKSDSQIAQS